ncbi:MAG: hypothetical protein KGH59_03495 [Candidatus Micrarchaeota archaeon]|nr:hypothetical protein [Candidatus Micrarchaeota archaeon]MDE1804820.1 hypothetical protein [Candidatus Micrarchaeota archaeon]MDE1847104.1 hypothetical protein [Candidatus Micrarchaeota archaeon]
MEDLLCRTITKLTLPAVRAAVSEELSKKGYTQSQIADSIGIVQVGVGKYLNKKYSVEVREIKEFIQSRGLCKGIVEGIINGRSLQDTEYAIDRLCNDSELLDFSMRMVVARN